jgi:two-component system phosphate regulon sensor histidine kinase PhoR
VVLLTLQDTTRLRLAEQMRGDFVANASHELRTPLASMMSFIETIQGPARNDPEARERFIGIMAEQGRRMARLIDDLLSLSRVEMNAHLPPSGEVDLVEIVTTIADSLSPLARERKVAVRIDPGEERPLRIPGDRDELLRVFENLIENAIKYGESGGEVDVAIACAGGAERRREAVVSVRDYGPGIAEEHLPRLTERFYRVDLASSRDKGGTGLGLAIVKHILNRHRGRLNISSRPGEGAEFRVSLPAYDPTVP